MKSVTFRRIVTFSLLLTLVAIGVCVTGTTWLFRRAEPNYAGRAFLPGLTSSVSIYRDGYGVPHIFAADMTDAIRALGYVHASERIFQMEMQRRAGQGRLAETVGPAMLPVDKFIRTLGLYHLATSSFAALSPDAQSFFQAYADGVNAWLDTHKNTLPPEFLLLGLTPEPWKPIDSVVWGKLMGLQLSHNYKLEILRAQVTRKLTPAQMHILFPLSNDTPITTEPHSIKTDASPLGEKNTALAQLGKITSLDHAASNEWVIAGSRTETEKPILANDPHLGLEAPILWYLARIVTKELEIKGVTVPGLPIVLLGQNDHIAWGFTTTGSDVEDLFIETTDPKNPENYLTPSGSEPFTVRSEIIHVKDGADVTLKTRATRHGPVLSDIDGEMAALAGGGKVLALAFTGLGDKDTTSEALMRLDRAKNWQDFMAALTLYQTPPQNVVYADVDGNIGFINPGLVPVRKSGDGTMPVAGASGAYDWLGMIPFTQLPQLYNPAAGFIFNANNAVVGSGSTTFMGVDWEEPYRAERLQEFFNTISKHSLETSAMMQADHVSLVARQLLPYLLRVPLQKDLLSGTRRAEAVNLLKNWDGAMDKNRPEPLIFDAWLYQLHQLLLTDKTGNDLAERGPYAATSLALILANNMTDWCGGKNCGEVVATALDKALDMLTARDGGDIEKWRWGDEHVALLGNTFFSHVPGLDRLTGLSVPSSGDFYTLDRGGSFTFDPQHPFARTHGGGFRGLYDLSDPARSRFMITTGESGHVFSPHYGDLVPLWNEVKSFTLSGTRQELAAQGLPELVLEPVKQ